MTSPSKLNEYNHAEEPARELLERLGWTYVPRDVLAPERGDQRDVLLKGRLKAALMRLNQWMTVKDPSDIMGHSGRPAINVVRCSLVVWLSVLTRDPATDAFRHTTTTPQRQFAIN